MADKPPDEHHTIYATKIIIQVEVSAAGGWTGKVSSVDSTDISKIMGVAIADIAKVGGV